MSEDTAKPRLRPLVSDARASGEDYCKLDVGTMPKKGDQNIRSVARIQPATRAGSDAITIGLDGSIAIDLGRLAAPQVSYDADCAWIEHEPGRVSLLFGKLDRNQPDRFRTRLEVKYPPENFIRSFWNNSREFHEKLRMQIAKWPTTALRADAPPKQANKDHSEWTNFEYMAYAGSQATIDFYKLSPGGVARFAKGQGTSALDLLPVVHVQLAIFELVGLLDAADSVVKAVREYLPLDDKV